MDFSQGAVSVFKVFKSSQNSVIHTFSPERLNIILYILYNIIHQTFCQATSCSQERLSTLAPTCEFEIIYLGDIGDIFNSLEQLVV